VRGGRWRSASSVHHADRDDGVRVLVLASLPSLSLSVRVWGGRINGETVGGFSVKYNVDVNWTCALRYVLDDLQDLMVVVTAHTAAWAPSPAD
jgi:hypothetical protein